MRLTRKFLPPPPNSYPSPYLTTSSWPPPPPPPPLPPFPSQPLPSFHPPTASACVQLHPYLRSSPTDTLFLPACYLPGSISSIAGARSGPVTVTAAAGRVPFPSSSTPFLFSSHAPPHSTLL
ncbi:hypothetical protein CGRA01v4_03586 [Colletotrichum graminicola]|nr:hypothetical protein CGRA01v4_03586 [Colletotrichum graminicola]